MDDKTRLQFCPRVKLYGIDIDMYSVLTSPQFSCSRCPAVPHRRCSTPACPCNTLRGSQDWQLRKRSWFCLQKVLVIIIERLMKLYIWVVKKQLISFWFSLKVLAQEWNTHLNLFSIFDLTKLRASLLVTASHTFNIFRHQKIFCFKYKFWFTPSVATMRNSQVVSILNCSIWGTGEITWEKEISVQLCGRSAQAVTCFHGGLSISDFNKKSPKLL